MPIHAQHALADYNLGMDLIRQKKYAEAKNCLKKAWTCETPVVSAGIEYGFLCLKSRDDSEALDIFGRILEKTAGSPRALAGKGIALVHTGQGDEGMRLLEPLLQDGFDEPLAYYTAAAFLETQGKCEKALVYYRRGLQIIVDIDQEE
jgi:tetratricopeptide (TPR) repeat protein